ncbi:MAG: hypothetical protein [Siphoviridae sp. cttb18]|nr:MAG: hypothetical protein [Siphoviridae sp. cttb18]
MAKRDLIPLENLTKHFVKETTFDCHAVDGKQGGITEDDFLNFSKELEDLMRKYKICNVEANIFPIL